MSKEQLVMEITEIVKGVLKHCDFELKDETTAEEIKGWDSLSHMVIITKIEEHFHIKFDFLDILNINNIGQLIDLVQTKLG